MAGGFDANTRRRLQDIGSLTRPAGDSGLVQSFDLPRTGFLARILLRITGSVSGTLSAQNNFGFSSVIKRISLVANDGPRLFNISGPGYAWMLADFLDAELAPVGTYDSGRTAITATTYEMDWIIPLQLNRRDPVGLLRLASNQNTFRVEVEWETQANVATGATVAGVIQPTLEFFSIPADPKDWPPTLETLAHVILEESMDIPATGEFRYSWPRQNVYLQMLHGAGFGVSPAFKWDRVSWVVNRQDYIENTSPQTKAYLDFGFWHGRNPAIGTTAFDLIGSSGLGDYGTMRDTFDSASFTDVETVFNVTDAPVTLKTIRRQLVRLPRGG